jgi:mRNA interferase RelE/StbE
MESYQVEFSKSAQKDLDKIPKQQVAKIIFALDKLALDPSRAANSKKMVNWEKTYRLRVGDFRVLYELENSVLVVYVVAVVHRKDIYR